MGGDYARKMARELCVCEVEMKELQTERLLFIVGLWKTFPFLSVLQGTQFKKMGNTYMIGIANLMKKN